MIVLPFRFYRDAASPAAGIRLSPCLASHYGGGPGSVSGP